MAIVRFPFDHFHMSGVGEYAAAIRQAGYDVPISEDLGALRNPFVVNGRRFENSMAVQPLEGLDGCEDGSPSELTLARYEKLAAQGAGILWVEATAVCPEGRDGGRQLWLHTGSVNGFARLVKTIDEAAAKAGHKPPYKILQLTHSGRCSKDAAGNPKPLAAFASPYLDPLMGNPEIVTDAYLDQLQLQAADAAALAADAGFDAVELKLCHQYLFKELLCAYQRPGKYGGSQENRFRFALETVDRIRGKLAGRADIAIRLNAYDGIPWPYGWGMAPSQEGAPKNVLPIGDAAVQAGSAQSNKAGAVASNWSGNADYRQVPVETSTNWPGNPSPLSISDEEKSSWQGNPGFERASDGQRSSWQGNAAFGEITGSARSNWSGNPSPIRISEGEKSSWQGNPGRDHVEGTVASNWPGNPDFVPEACRGCTAMAAACATCPVLKEACVSSNWQGNPGFIPQACRSCTASAGDCSACEVAQAAASLAIPPMPGPMQIDLTEVKELMHQLYRRGVRLFNLSTNSPRFAPTGSGFLDNFSETAQVDPYAGAAALLSATKEIRAAMPSDVKIVGTGLSWFGPYSANVASGGIRQGWFDIAGFGRSVMTDNGFVPAILQGRTPDPAKSCMGCDSCFKLFFAGLPTGCAIHHQAYKDLFKQALAEGRVKGNIIE